MSISELRRDIENQRKKEEESSNYLGNLARSGLGQGVALGFGDEIEAGAGAAYDKFVKGKDFTDSYGTRVKNVRGDIAKFKETNPVAAYGSEILGTVGTGAFAIPKLLAKGASKLGSKGVQNVAANQYVAPAVTSGIYGAGIGEDTGSDRLKNAATLAASGAALQKGLGVLAPKISQSGKYLLEKGIAPAATKLFSAKDAAGSVASKLIPGTVDQLQTMSSSFPAVGIPVANFKVKGLLNYNMALIDDALEPLGVKLPREGMVKSITESLNKIPGVTVPKSSMSVGKFTRPIANSKDSSVDWGLRPAIDFAENTIDDAYTSILGKSNLSKEVVKNIKGENRSIINKAIQKYKLDPKITGKLKTRIEDIFENRFYNTLGTITKPKDVDGKTLQVVQSEIKKLKLNRIFQKDNDTSIVIDDIINNIMNKLDDSSAAGLKKLDIASARFAPIKDLYTTALGKAANKGEIITPTEYLKKAIQDARKRGLRGVNDEFESVKLSNIAQEYLGDTFPDSGTASRLLLSGDLGGTGTKMVGGLMMAIPAMSETGQTIQRNLPRLMKGNLGAKNPVLQSGVLSDDEELVKVPRRGLLK
mgnify:CR=1 FL=1